MNTNVRIALIDDHQLFREGLRAIIAKQPDLEVVGEAADARQGYGVVESSRPDVVVLDLSLPGTDGIAAARELKRRAPTGKVLVLSMHAEAELAAQALKAGAAGYALKNQPSQTVVAAIRQVARGERYIAPEIEPYLPEKPAADDAAGPIGTLSLREREIFALLVRGFTNRAIAQELCISIKTVETHRTHIHRKLNVHSVAELVRFAARHNLLKD